MLTCRWICWQLQSKGLLSCAATLSVCRAVAHLPARCWLPLPALQHGQAPLSDLQCTTSSEALLCGKAPTFRLLVWAIDRSGAHMQHVTYVVSESFVVATKRVKHAIKSDIPSIADHISKLVHIGKATVDKLQDIRQAAVEENLDLELPEELNRVDKVGGASRRPLGIRWLLRVRPLWGTGTTGMGCWMVVQLTLALQL